MYMPIDYFMLVQTLLSFHAQIIDLLQGQEYECIIPTLQEEDLEWLTEYLDNVSLRTAFVDSTSNVG